MGISSYSSSAETHVSLNSAEEYLWSVITLDNLGNPMSQEHNFRADITLTDVVDVNWSTTGYLEK